MRKNDPVDDLVTSECERPSKDFTPLVMWFLLMSGIVVIALFRPARILDIWTGYPINFDRVFIISYIAWMLMELRISRKDLNTGDYFRSGL